MALVEFSKHNCFGLITLNRPEALNALNLEMICDIKAQLLVWQEDDAVKAVIVQAKKGRAFCAGGDIKAIYKARDVSFGMHYFNEEYALNLLISNYKKPYIALMDGITMGGGVGLSFYGSHRIACTDSFKFAMPETAIGFFPDVGASFILSKLPHALGMYLALTGALICADECFEFDMISAHYNSQTYHQLTSELLSLDIKDNAEEIIHQWLIKNPISHHKMDFPMMKIHQHFNHHSIQEIFYSLELDNESWAQETLTNLKLKSPLSLCVTFEQINRAKAFTMAECLKQDSILVKHFLMHHEFYEGIRAQLIDRDKKPHWMYQTVNEVDKKMVDSFFIP